MDIYQENGFKDRNDYLLHLAEEYNVDYFTVRQIAEIYGESEDFDGLLVTLEDFSDGL